MGQYIMRHKRTWLTLLAVLALLSSFTLAQEESGSGEVSGEGEEEAVEAEEGGEEAAEDGSGDSGDGGEDGAEDEDGAEEEVECEVEETDGSGSGDDDVANILALGGENKNKRFRGFRRRGTFRS